MSALPSTPPQSSPREATLSAAILSGAVVAFGALAALALAGRLPIVAGAVSSMLTQASRFLGAPAAADSHLYWYMARSAGVVAYVLLWGSVVWGLMVTNKVLDGVVKPLVTYELHQFLSVAALAFGAFHGFILLGDSWIKFGLTDLLIPFASTLKPVWMGFGVLSFYLTAILVISFYVKKRIGHRAWRLLHYASFAAWAMVTFHALMTGSDTASPLMLILYLTATASVGFLTIYRILTAKVKNQPAPARK